MFRSSTAKENKTAPGKHLGPVRRFRYFLWDKWPYWILTGIVFALLFFFLWHRIVVWVEAGEGAIEHPP
ncbi:MAG: hypothetical protein D3908_11430, partial [Candidatus Electrothrix sp. AUS4]|nr:hypothetical protein [Candidatus Electrothrix sp. AUS4]